MRISSFTFQHKYSNKYIQPNAVYSESEFYLKLKPLVSSRLFKCRRLQWEYILFLLYFPASLPPLPPDFLTLICVPEGVEQRKEEKGREGNLLYFLLAFTDVYLFLSEASSQG